MNGTSGSRPIARKAAIVAIALGIWAALALLFAAPLALTGPVSWRQAISVGGSYWALWLLFLPAVAWLSFRFPIERRSLLRKVAIHLFACLLIVGAGRITFPAVARNLPRSQRLTGRTAPGAPGVFHGLRAGLDVLVYWSLAGACQGIRNFRISQERERRAAELEAMLT